MATQEQKQALTALYVGYFDRAPDPDGLQFWIDQIDGGREFNTIAADFAASAEAEALYPYLTTPDVSSPAAFITNIYANLFGRAPDNAGLDFWSGVLEDGSVSVADMIEAIINGAVDDADAGTFDKTVLDNKIEVGLDWATSTGDVPGFEFDAAAKAAAVAAVNGVTEDEATVVAAKADTDAFVGGAANPGDTFTLTAGVDNLVGTENNDTFNATETATSSVLGGLDKVDGGLGVDTLNIADTATAAAADFALPAGLTVTNVEKMAITTNGAIGTSSGTAFDVSGFAGLTEFTGVAAGAGTAAGSNIKAAGTTDVNLTVAGNNQVDIAGGKAVAVVSGAAGTGTVGVVGKDLTSVSIKGGGVATVDNLGGAAGTTTATGTTLKSVTLDAIAGATAAVKGGAVDTLTVQNQASGLATTVTNGTSTALTVNVDNAGYNALGVAVPGVSVAAGAAATTINLNATGAKSNVSVSGAAAKTLNVTGSADLTLAAPLATATKIDGSAATGSLTLGTLNAATVAVSTGAGNDSFTVQAAAKATVASGAGNDVVTLGSALAAGSTVDLGAGNDTLLGTTAPAASTATAVTMIDGGEGTDSVSSAMINVGNAAQFANFENVSLAGGNLDLDLMTGSAITGLSIDTTATTIVSNATTAQSLTVNASGTSSTIGFKGVTGASDAYAINFNAMTTGTTAAPTAVNAGTVVVNGIENLTIDSGSAAGVNANAITLTDSTLQTLTITGDQAATVAFAGTNGTLSGTTGGVSLIDGSAATGALNIDTSGGAFAAATAGLTVNTGSGKDVITLGQKATVDAGAGDDVITTSANGGTLTGGAGADKFDVSAAGAGSTVASAAVITNVVDLVSGETIQFNDVTGTSTFNATKVDVSAATNLQGALDAATATAVVANDATFTWFQYGTDTYVVQDVSTTVGLDANDTVVKLTGLQDLSGSNVVASDLFTYA